MADIDTVNPLIPLWPTRPTQRPGPKKRPPRRNSERPERKPGDAERDESDSDSKRIDEYV